RARLEHESGLQSDARQRCFRLVHADGDDGRSGDLPAGGASLSGVDVLGLPATRRPGGLRRREDADRPARAGWRGGPGRPAAGPRAVAAASVAMRSLDRRLLRSSRVARVHLVAAVVLGFIAAVALVAQAVLLARIVARVFLESAGLGDVRRDVIA